MHRALYGRIGIAPLFGAFFAYNANFIWGFFNYYFAAGLSFAIFAGLDRDRRPQRPWPAAGRLHAWPSPLLYFCHIFAAASLLLMLAGFEAGPELPPRQSRCSPPWRAAPPAWRCSMFPPRWPSCLLKPRSIDDAAACEFNLADTMLDRFESLVAARVRPAATMRCPPFCSAGLALALVLAQGAPASGHVGHAGGCC